MGIITAGVIMNIFLGVACFTLYASQGGMEVPAVLGGVVPGTPAYSAGLRAGDEVVAIDGRRDVDYNRLRQRVSLSGTDEKLLFTVRGAGSAEERTIPIEPRRDADSLGPRAGLYPANGLKLFREVPFRLPPGQDDNKLGPLGGFKGGDVVVAVGPVGGELAPVADHEDFRRKLENLRAVPIVVEVERTGPATEDGKKAPTARAKVTLPPHHFLDFGFRLAFGSVGAIRKDSPAEKAGFKLGDRVVAVDGEKDFDPTRLPEYIRDRAGRPVTLTVDRPAEATGKVGKTLDVVATPDASPAWVDPVEDFGGSDLFDIPGLGLALSIEPRVLAVREGSPAAKAGIKAGDVLRSLTITPAKFDSTRPKPVTIPLEKAVPGWAFAFANVQARPWTTIEIATNRAEKPVAIRPEVDPGRSHPLRGLNFELMTRPVPPAGLVDSLRLGVEETWENAFAIVKILKSLTQGRVGADAFGGLPSIATLAYDRASTGIIPFIHFLGVLSVNLAVLNFLPIPPLDGGQFVFLTAEKVRGRPLPEAALNVMQIAGVALVLGLILFVNVKDIVRLVWSFL